MPRFERLKSDWCPWSVVIWTGVGGLHELLSVQLWQRFPLMSAIGAGLHALTGAALLVACFVAGLQAKTDGLMRTRFLAAVGFIPAGAALFLAAPALERASVRLEFQLVRAGYAEVVAAVEAGRAPPASTPDGAWTRVDPGPPVRVAFDWGGLADNWHGVVHDPSEIVATARGRGAASNSTASLEARRLFGGDLVACIRLDRSWFYCGFS